MANHHKHVWEKIDDMENKAKMSDKKMRKFKESSRHV